MKRRENLKNTWKNVKKQILFEIEMFTFFHVLNTQNQYFGAAQRESSGSVPGRAAPAHDVRRVPLLQQLRPRVVDQLSRALLVELLVELLLSSHQ